MGRINFRSGIWTCDREGANSAAEVVPPYRMLKFRFSLSQDQIPLRKLFLPIIGTNSAEEIVPPYNRYNFRSSLSQEQIPLRKLFLPIACTNSTANLFLPIACTNSAAKCFLPIACTTAAPPYRRSKCRCGSCSSLSQVQISLLNCYTLSQVQIPQRKLFLGYHMYKS